jgi:hypothetical protein
MLTLRSHQAIRKETRLQTSNNIVSVAYLNNLLILHLVPITGDITFAALCFLSWGMRGFAMGGRQR